MNAKKLHAFLVILAACTLWLGLPALAAGSIVDLMLVPSATDVLPNTDLDVAVWLYPGTTSGGSLALSSAEFEVFWDVPNLAPRAGADPTLGPQFNDPFWSAAYWVASDRAYLLAGSFADIAVGGAGILLMTIPLTAGSIPGPANINFDFFMQEAMPPEATVWAGGNEIFVPDISATPAAVNVVPVPASLILFGTGLVGLWLRSRRQG